MACWNALRIFGVIVYTLSELASLLFVFLYLIEENNQISDEIFHFVFSSSTFDILLFGILRFCIQIGALIGLLYNKRAGIDRLKKYRTFPTIYGCVQATFIVVKILAHSDNKRNEVQRFWIMVAITLFSNVTFYCCCRVLASCKMHTQTLRFNVNAEGSYENVDSFPATDEIEAGTDELTSGKIICKLLNMAKPDCLFFLTALAFLVICSVCQTVVPYYTGLIVNYIIVERNPKKFNTSLFSLTLVSFFGVVAAGIRAGCFRYVLGRYKLRLQYTLFSNLMQMEMGFFDSHKTGELTSRLTSDCAKVSDGISLRLNIFLRCSVKVCVIVFFMVKLSWKLSTVVLVSLPIVTIVSDYFGVKYKELAEEVQDSLAFANSSAGEALSSMKTVRTFAAENHESNRYYKLLESTRLIMKKQSFVSAGYRWSVEITNLTMTLLILYYGGNLVMKNQLAGSHLISFILYSFELTYAILDIGSVYTGLMGVIGASKSIFLYINRKNQVKTDGELIPDAGIDGHVEFKDVSFAYPSREEVTVLKKLSFTAEKGEVVALVGPSGGGKSSVINLLQHFYEPTEGEILIDGVSVMNYNHDFLHEKMSLVQQEPVLFARSITENIKYGLKTDISDSCIHSFAELANAHSFIISMPEKYDTQTGEKGVQLSGGQKQRIAIARALIRNPAILLLDEATSALDSESEHLVQQAINKNLIGRTVIVIAHRLSTVEKADKIIVIEKGEIVEVGKHHELLEKHGAYAALVEKQLLGASEKEVT